MIKIITSSLFGSSVMYECNPRRLAWKIRRNMTITDGCTWSGVYYGEMKMAPM